MLVGAHGSITKMTGVTDGDGRGTVRVHKGTSTDYSDQKRLVHTSYASGDPVTGSVEAGGSCGSNSGEVIPFFAWRRLCV